MLRVSATVRCGGAGQALYSLHSTLPSDFFACMHDYFGATLHVPCYIGARTSQMRGLFYGHEPRTRASNDRVAPLEANQPIVTVPLASLYTVNNVASKPNALPRATLDAVQRAVAAADDEFALMAPQLYMGLQFSAIVDAVPHASSADDDDAVARITAVCSAQAMPWARLLDDEDFNTDFVYGMYGGALDTWQRDSYHDMTRKFDTVTAAVHAALRPLPFNIEHYRRITRLVLARLEHVPTFASFDTRDSSATGGVSYRVQRRVMRQARRVVRAVRAALARQRRLPARLRAALAPCATTELAMVPCIDLVNHSNRPNCAVRFARSRVLHGAPAVTLYSLMRVLPGQELCRHYNFALSRPVALFRYGFLPFELISVVNIDAANEYVFKHRDKLLPESPEVVSKARRETEEVARLERLYQAARQSTSPPP